MKFFACKISDVRCEQREHGLDGRIIEPLVLDVIHNPRFEALVQKLAPKS